MGQETSTAPGWVGFKVTCTGARFEEWPEGSRSEGEGRVGKREPDLGDFHMEKSRNRVTGSKEMFFRIERQQMGMVAAGDDL